MSERPAHSERAGIVIVFYRPDRDCVSRANRLASEWPCVVVDNTEEASSADALGLDRRITYLANGANLGVATALNQGISQLKATGCTCSLLFDQDSEPSAQLLTELPRTLAAERARNNRVAMVGPAYEDARLGGVAPFVRFGCLRLKRIEPTGEQPVEVDFLITSGSCLNLAVWSDIGPMDESLFIDFVDLEWCVRARSKGYLVLGAPALRLSHELGGEPVRIFGRRYPGHNPVRHYYLFRNAVALLRRGYVPWSWKSTELVKMPIRLAIYGLFMQPRIAHLRMSILGIWHGLTGRSGAL
ncbi:glycosyltransferase family 2 protein [Burkholderia multivorans]|uniref:glycosyltransferase family 2 protein n=1 Tax=Burkholderia multivorans TaxID=87883 RepID=UPI0005BA013B|nr:glycosyltransferase family 2 protein [Burkholderia multivorans]MCA8317460.1 glycosyltransferase family 2 protein [Burkholderia multivorans]MCL4645222.1 glycosyltransferase family 2 protein [Burkholderia multivorans]UQN87658.1 glycosyltransferase family 2 protein [Burkholderia multivorans]UQO72847.1 glycosyltransferase family 2 protein [Burkholderia multivorans]UQP27108.1 glycosyltransferase family 2 protein [Burkholderia multivorans]